MSRASPSIEEDLCHGLAAARVFAALWALAWGWWSSPRHIITSDIGEFARNCTKTASIPLFSSSPLSLFRSPRPG